MTIGPRAHASCQCDQSELELVFVIDTTSSMKHMIATVRAQAEKIVHVLAAHIGRVRVGLVAYRTAAQAGVGGYMERAAQPLTFDREKIVGKIRALKAEGGGIENPEEGLARAVNEMKWTRGRRKVVILIGDEGPDPDKVSELHAMARLAARRGIVVNTITVSESASIFWGNFNPQKRKALERLNGPAWRKSFRLPVFVETARLGGGRAAGSHNVRDLVKSVLSIGLSDNPGFEVDDKTARKVVEWSGPKPEKKKPKAASPRGGAALFARLQHAGVWNVPHDEGALMAHLSKRLAVAGTLRMQPVRATDKKLFRYGLLYITGHSAMKLSGDEKRRLRTFCERGGTILADPCCGRKAFDRSFRKLATDLFGENALKPLAVDHEIFDVAYDIGEIRFCVSHKQPRYTKKPPRLEGVALNGRLAVIYSPVDIGCGWSHHEFGAPCQLHDDDALRLTVNTVVHVLTQ